MRGIFATIRRKLRPLPFANHTLIFFGDSHVNTIRIAHERGMFGKRMAEFVRVPGATAVGLRHPTSKTQALQTFREHLLPYRPNVIPVFQLGEVDCGFVIWVRAKKYGESIDEQLAQSIDAYVKFLAEMRDAGYRRLIVTSAVLPTIRDGQLDGEVAHLRRQVTATLKERTALTLRYNSELKAEVMARGITFLDLTPRLIDKRTGVIADRFRHPSIADHHMDPATAGKVWAQAIEEALGQLT